MTNRRSRQKARARGRKQKSPNSSPISNTTSSSSRSSSLRNSTSVVCDPQSSVASPFQTPPTSPSSPTEAHLLSIDIDMVQNENQGDSNSTITAENIVTKDILTLADVFAKMKMVTDSMTSALDRLGNQTEKMVSCSLDIKAAEQLRPIQSELERQIAKHKVDIDTLRSTLGKKIKDAVEQKIRSDLNEVIKTCIQGEIEDRVRQQLKVQIPEDLRKQVFTHERDILEIQTNLHNSEARRYNNALFLQTSPIPNARLKPLLRPLPTPEQSPVFRFCISSSEETSGLPTPASDFPRVPAPTPIKRVVSSSLRSAVTATASPIFPRDVASLISLSQEDLKRLLQEYGLNSAVNSPLVDNAKPRLPSVHEEASEEKTQAEEDESSHEKDLNKFIAHIGVPILMVAPKDQKEDPSVRMSSQTRRKLLTPLIIKQ